MMNDEDHRKANSFGNIIQRLLIKDMQDHTNISGVELNGGIIRICDVVHGDGDELILALNHHKRFLRIRIDVVAKDYLEMSQAKAEADETIGDIEDYLRGK